MKVFKIGSGHRGYMDFPGSARLECLCGGTRSRPGGENIIDKKNSLVAQQRRSRGDKCVAHVFFALSDIEARLGLGFLSSAQPLGRKKAMAQASEVARNFFGLIVATFTAPLTAQRNRNDGIDFRKGKRVEMLGEIAAQGQDVLVL